MRASAALLFVLSLLAGCLGGATPPADPTTQAVPAIEIDENRPEPVFGNVTVGPSAQPDLNATLAAAPRLIPGEWWRIQLESPLTGDKQEFIRVLAAVEGDTYVFGMPHEGWWKEAVIYHTPAF